MHLTRRHDQGSSLLSVIIVMLVLSILALTSAAVVTSTTRSLAGTRASSQARAAADAGLAALTAVVSAAPDPCTATAPSRDDALRYETEIKDCGGGTVTFKSTGHDDNDNTTAVVEAGYAYTIAGEAGIGGDMVFFKATVFSHEVLAHTLNDELLSIVISSGSFTCMAPIPANIVVAGDFNSSGGCTIEGSVVAGGRLNITNGPDWIKGNATAAGTARSILRGTIGDATPGTGELHTAGDIEFGWENKTVSGSVRTPGNVQLANVKILGSLTLPSARTLTTNSGTVLGGIIRPSAVTPPPAPTFESWFDYKYQLSDWQPYGGAHYTPITLVNSGDGPGTCNYFNRNDPANQGAKGWRDLANLTAPTILDARACTELTSRNGSTPVVALRANIVFLAKSFDFTALTLKAAAGASPKLWFIVEDTLDNNAPTCVSGRNIKINGTEIWDGVTALAYTPCTIDVAGMGNDAWTGAFYGNGFQFGGGLDFYGSPIALPGMPSAGGGPTGPGATPTVLTQQWQRDR